MYIRIQFWNLWKKYVIGVFDNEREPYNIGHTDMSLEDIENSLINMGYQPDYFSFNDKGQITSMRKMYIEDGIWRQMHVRVFDDGEVTGHDELTYEEDSARHLKGDTLKPINDSDIALIKAHLKVIT